MFQIQAEPIQISLKPFKILLAKALKQGVLQLMKDLAALLHHRPPLGGNADLVKTVVALIGNSADIASLFQLLERNRDRRGRDILMARNLLLRGVWKPRNIHQNLMLAPVNA